MLDDISRALHIAEKPMHRAEGGSVDTMEGFDFAHGLLASAGHGRTDTLPVNVPSGAYVLPADVVSGLGQGNTIAGAKVLDRVFEGMPYYMHGGAYGSPMPEGKRGSGPPGAPAPRQGWGPPTAGSPPPSPGPGAPAGSPPGGYNLSAPLPQLSVPQRKKGGPVPYKKVAIIAAGGEYIIHPDIVRYIGGGDMSKGHTFLDSFVKDVRERTRKTLGKLPGPAKS